MLWSTIFSVLGQLATGILIFIAFVPPSKIGKGFGRFHAGLALALWLLAFRGDFGILPFVLISCLILTLLFAWHDFLYYSFLACSIILSLGVLIKNDLPQLGLAGALLIHVPPALVLGASSVAMLLGHWYLVAPKLPIAYLKTLTIALIITILIRSIILGNALLQSGEQLEVIRFFDRYGMFFWQRVILGLILTLVLSVMTYFCVRIRSTQSATGILYVVLVFCLIGEIIAHYLSVKTGLIL
ncbi:MAG TPA: hypothetical protein VLH08_15140 [Acidobacteriota bacterium]|nr:hypothetical protein [Acidobacteriota bacterium]